MSFGGFLFGLKKGKFDKHQPIKTLSKMKLTPRYLGLLAFCAAAFVSCQREVELDQVLPEEPLTRTTYSADNSIVWQSGDQLRVRQVCYTGSGNNVSAHAQLRASNAPVLYEGKYYVQASFDAVSPAPYVGHESYKFQYQAFYPAARAEKDGTKVKLTLPDVQQPRANSFDPGADLVVSDQVYSKTQRTDGLKVYGLTFSRLSSVGVLTIKGLESNAVINTIEISAGNKPLAGTYKIDINNSRTLDNKKYKITLNMAGNQPSNPRNFKVYFTCLPATYTNVEVKITTGNQGTYVRTFNQLVFTQGQKTNVPDIQIKKKVLMTYNVGTFNKKGDYMYSEIAGLLVENNANYVSLNEVDEKTERSDYHDQLAKLTTFMNNTSGNVYSSYFGPAIDPYNKGKYGNGVVSKENVLQFATLKLTNKLNETDTKPAKTPSGKNEETRNLCVVETADCVFAATHLGLNEDLRITQVGQINQWFESHYGNTKKPVFICGDFNAEPDEARTLMVTPGNWVFVSDPTQNSFNTGGKNPAKCIDYIFCRNNAAAPTVNVINAAVVRSAENGDIKTFSDHYPVRVEVAW